MRRVAFPALAFVVVPIFTTFAACAPSAIPKKPVPTAKHETAHDAAAAPSIAVVCAAPKLPDPEPVGLPPDPEIASSGRVAAPSDPKNTCEVADSNIASVEDAILRAAEAAQKTAAPTFVPWDHKSKPAQIDLVDKRLTFTRAERRVLDTNGFVVLARTEMPSYALALHEIYQSQLPLYVSLDAVMHAIYVGNDKLIAAVERERLAPLLRSTLDAFACALPAASAAWPSDARRDVDLYVAVARTLLADAPVGGVLGIDGVDDEVAKLAAEANKAEAMKTVTLFGRERWIDFTAYTPRGHYAGPSGEGEEKNTLTAYFRAAMWLSRLELNLVSRSSRSSAATPVADPRETPREAVDALALAELADRANAMPAVTALDRAWALFAGKREDVSLADLAKLRAKARITTLAIPGASDALKAAIGQDFQRRARLHYMPEGSSVLPAITTLLGPRAVPDATATRPLVNPDVAGRYMIGAADMAYALGHDRAKAYLGDAMKSHPELEKQLDKARAIVNEPLGTEDLYGAWFGAIRALADKPQGALPSYWTTPAFADLRIDTALASFGQIRHNYVLMAGQSYDEGGCEIPDGYVEPAPAVYDALVAYADRGAVVMKELDVHDTTGALGYFARLGKVLRVLRAIGNDELAGKPLSADAKRFLSLVVEMTPGGTGGAPTYTGWYFDMFRDRVGEGLADADFVADYFTSGYTSKIAYVGTSAPRLGVFVVDSGGAPRVVVGPVARAYEHEGPQEKRMSDESAKALPASARHDAWAASYTAPAIAAPPLAMRTTLSIAGDDEKRTTPGQTLVVKSTRALGPVTIELLDHHRVTFATTTLAVGAGITRFVFASRVVAKGKEQPSLGAIRVRVGDWTFVSPRSGPGGELVDLHFGGMESLPYDIK